MMIYLRRRRWVTGLLIIGLVTTAGAFWWSRSRPQYNVLLITLDTTRADHIGCYGYADAHTPTLDALAADGVVFETPTAPCR